jgi:hypothetical protein
VRFWTVRAKGLRFDVDEEGAALSAAQRAHSYRDRILNHDVVADFYRASATSILPDDDLA